MGFLDRLLGRAPQSAHPEGYPPYQPDLPPPRAAPSGEEVALERYRYLLRTAPAAALEEAHAEAFGRLTPEQRRQVLRELGAEVPPAERATSDDPRSLARMATRAEVRHPGTLERALTRRRMGPGTGGLLASSLFASLAGAFIGTAIASQLFDVGDDLGGDLGGDDLGGW